MHILFYTELSPYPINRGERIRSYGLLKALSLTGHSVTAVIGNEEELPLDKYKLDNVKYIPFNFAKKNIQNNWKRYFAHFLKNPDITRLFQKIIRQEKPTIAFIDYNFCGEYIPFFKKQGLKVIYGTHNSQASLLLQKPAKTLKNKLSRFREFFMMHWHEKKYFKQADALISVSNMDKKYHQKFTGKARHYVIPNFLDEDLYQTDEIERTDYIVMMANFYAYQNFAGLEWFIDKVWNEKLAEKTSLKIIGFNSKESLEILKGKYEIPGVVEAIGAVEDIRPFNLKAKVSIVPLLHGSGSRLKCLESMALKTQLVSTSKGAEGIDHDGSIIIADDPDEFRDKLMLVLQNKLDTTEDAYLKFMETYSMKPNSELLKEVIENLNQ